ncbi:MAG: toxin-antitoxin system HicB family antitoxin [Oscillospiraceae bacterium]|nr:toxin-antitoxin system HicB family antitoxin [Oscillospiraceae bacterium]
MEKISIEEFLRRVEATPTVKPDEWDLKMLAEIEAETDNSTISLEEAMARRKCSGKISLRVPKELHTN